MMKRSLLIAFVLTLTTTNTHARFTQADAWMGIDQQPISLNKYAYGNADPVNRVDPTGNFASLAEFGISSSVQSQMILVTGATVGVGAIMYGASRSDTMGNSGAGSRGWGVWDIIASGKYRAGMAMSLSLPQRNAKAKAEAIALAATAATPHGHHTIPKYLCGRSVQRYSFIDASSHAQLHTGLGMAKIALTAAEEKATKMLPSFTRHRTDHVLKLAQNKPGRKIIASSIRRFYLRGGWMGRGHPTIGTVFSGEKKLFIDGDIHSSCE